MVGEGAGAWRRLFTWLSIDLHIFWYQLLSVVSGLLGGVLSRGEGRCIEVDAVLFVTNFDVNRLAGGGEVNTNSRRVLS